MIPYNIGHGFIVGVAKVILVKEFVLQEKKEVYRENRYTNHHD
jgi:hypothetical protein